MRRQMGTVFHVDMTARASIACASALSLTMSRMLVKEAGLEFWLGEPLNGRFGPQVAGDTPEKKLEP